MWSWKNWRRKRALMHSSITADQWGQVEATLSALDGMSPDERKRLRELAVLFLSEKSIEPVSGLQLAEPTRLSLALQASLPVLNLSFDWYDGWVAIIVYPDEFVSDHEAVDEAGVVHRVREARSGESWQHGPVILSLSDVKDREHWDGHNVVIHEFAHKLDMLNGDANGLPPLHRDMRVQDWSAALSRAFEDLRQRVDRAEPTFIDPYATESPGEFFAVVSEVFFEAPEELHAVYPAVYEQLRQFYRQDPLARFVAAQAS